MYAERKREAEEAEERLRMREKNMKSKKKAVALERRSVKKIKKELGHAHTAVQKLNEIRVSQVCVQCLTLQRFDHMLTINIAEVETKKRPQERFGAT